MKKYVSSRIILAGLVCIFAFSCKKQADAITDQTSPANEQLMQQEAESSINLQKEKIARFEKELEQRGETPGTLSSNRQSNIVEIAVRLPIFKSLVAAVVKTGLAPTLASAELNATVFAPTDAAFSKLPAPFNNAQNIAAISDPAQIDALRAILLYHVLGAEVKAQDVANGRSSAVTLKPAGPTNDNTIYLSKNFGIIVINGKSLVLLPNVDASNGVIHVIEDVLLFPTQTIAGIATANASFSTLVAALVKTNLVGVFTGPGDFTVFAPTNQAFAALPAPFNNAANISGIADAGQIAALENILKYHVAAQRYFAFDFGIFGSIPTLAAPPNNSLRGILGFDVGYVKGRSNSSYAQARPANLLATNGVVHVVDRVLLP